jgi:hypothetical protein
MVKIFHVFALAYTTVFFFFLPTDLQGQSKRKNRGIMRDTLDGKLDFSRFLVEAHGFIPVPVIITEPALGNIGLAIAPLFLKPKKEIPKDAGYVPPDITAGLAMITANGSWASGAMRIGSIPKAGIKYRFGLAYADINLNYYRTLPSLGEQELTFNFRALPIFGSISKKITRNGLYAGVQYVFADLKVKPLFNGNLPEFIKPKDLDNQVGTLGVFADWDRRNSIFTPDKGFRANITFDFNDNWTASDFNYQSLSLTTNWFFPVRKSWISGLRLEWNQIFGSPPFYLYPSIILRGIPFGRYQGQAVLITETEQRFDLNKRWSVLGFAGYGRTFTGDDAYNDPQNIYNIGTGFRYLIARSFRIRTGIDVAMGPDSWGWYIVFGHNWNR